MTVVLLLVILAFGLTVMAFLNKAPLTLAVFCLCLIALIGVLPIGK